MSVAVTKDNKYIISVSSDKTIAIWNFETKELVHRFINAHKKEINSVAVTGDSKYILTGSSDYGMAIWSTEGRKLIHRFENAHRNVIFTVKVTRDNKYIVSGSSDHSIAIWNLEDKRLLHRFENAHKRDIRSVAITRDRRYIISGSGDNCIGIWDIQRTLTNIKSLPRLNACSKIYSDGLDPELKCSPEIKDISFIHEMAFLETRWNFLNFAIFLLPFVRPTDYLHFAIENKIYISLDAHNLTQLHYLLDYSGRKTPTVNEFCSQFFKNMSRFVNFESLGREQVLNGLTKLTLQIYRSQPSISLLGYLKCFVRPAEDIFEAEDFANLPNQGNLLNGKSHAFLKLKNVVTVPPKEEYYSIITKPKNNEETNDPTLQYELVLLSLDYYGNSTDSFNILNVFESFGVEENIFYEDSTVCYLIDFLWEKLERYLHFQVILFAANTALYTLFGIYYQDQQISTPILIVVVVFNFFPLAFQALQASAGLASFLKDPWNYFEVVTPVFQIISAILYWTAQGSLSETIFISTSILLLYTKFLITLRVFDPLRHMIRMILEILSDSKGFMVILLIYALGLTIAVYHNREVQQDSDGSGIYALNDVLMEMYAFAIGSWSYTEYAGVNIAFFLFASFLLPLVLLNMLIALMGDTYGRVQDNRQAFDSRERVLMLYELVSAAHQFTRLRNWIRKGKMSQESDAEGDAKESFYLLVVKEFSLSDNQIDLNAINDNQNGMKTQIETDMSRIDGRIVKMNDNLDDGNSKLNAKLDAKINPMKSEINSMKSEINANIISLKSEINDKMNSEIGSLNVKIDTMRKEMVSEILMALGTKPVSSPGKEEGENTTEEKGELQEIKMVKDSSQ